MAGIEQWVSPTLATTKSNYKRFEGTHVELSGYAETLHVEHVRETNFSRGGGGGCWGVGLWVVGGAWVVAGCLASFWLEWIDGSTDRRADCKPPAGLH